MELVKRILLSLAILALSSYRCVRAQTFTSCFNGVFVPCTKNKKCKAQSTVPLTLANCSKVVTAAVVRSCTSTSFSSCATKTGAKTSFNCNRAVSNYLFNTTVVRERNACLAMKTPCQELMSCTACGRNSCPVNVPLPTTKKPTSKPVKPPTKAPTRFPTSKPVKPPTKAPTKKPTAAPVKPPTKAPTKTPTSAPVKPPTTAPVKPPTKLPTKKPTASPAMTPTKAPAPKPTRKPTKAPTASPLTVVADTLPPGDISACTTADCQQKATCCVQNGGTLVTGGCINCLPKTYGGFYRCGFCDASAFPGNKETCTNFGVGSEWLRCEMPSGDTCNVQFCSWANLPNITDCTATC